MTSRVLSTFVFVSLISSVAAVDPADLKLQITNRTEDVKFSILDPAPKDITSNRKMPTLLSSPMSREKRQARFSTSTLKWVRMRYGNSLPRGAVYIYNSYVKRYDYVCKCGCQAGFYTPGDMCRYPYSHKELKCYSFQVLVNKDNFEILTWKDSSYGKVPQNSVRTCSTRDIYVGQNKYGLGKVHVSQKCFYLPWKGKEYWYRHYKVLTFTNRISREHISKVRYKIWEAKTTNYPEILIRSTIVNNQLNSIIKTFTLSKTYKEEKRWDTSTAITVAGPASISARLPFFTLAGIKYSAVITKQLSGGTSIMLPKSISINVKVRVPPQHSCRVSLCGHRYKIKIPFTARFSRTYQNGVTRRTSISGMYSGVNVIDLRSVVDRCVPLSDAKRLSLE
ncbi:natterin-3-like [Thunnus albacares]|uniref:natterin-3-like n=1 Tax=Thunnus albacares TaxID=8236 RepID=UPI001CF70BE2|nr:natterin-3-like [Thunnus albacares]